MVLDGEVWDHSFIDNDTVLLRVTVLLDDKNDSNIFLPPQYFVLLFSYHKIQSVFDNNMMVATTTVSLIATSTTTTTTITNCTHLGV